MIGIIFLYDRKYRMFDFKQLPSYINYVFAAYIIGYYLLAKYYYTGKYRAFALSVLLVVAGVILMEELVIEQIVYPDTRGKFFHGVLFSLAEVLPILLVLVSFKFLWDLHASQRKIEQLENAVRSSELKFLKTQINPHFLFNNLNNLYSYSITDPSKTSDMILELSSVLRYMLYDCQEQQVPLHKELQHLEHFVNLYEHQIEERGTVNIEIHNNCSACHIAPLIAVVFIENAFKHSTASMVDNIFIDIKVTVDADGKFNFSCINSYEDQSNTDNIVGGIGLDNVKKRLQLLYPDAHKLNIRTDNNKYQVDLEIQLNNMFI